MMMICEHAKDCTLSRCIHITPHILDVFACPGPCSVEDGNWVCVPYEEKPMETVPEDVMVICNCAKTCVCRGCDHITPHKRDSSCGTFIREALRRACRQLRKKLSAEEKKS